MPDPDRPRRRLPAVNVALFARVAVVTLGMLAAACGGDDDGVAAGTASVVPTTSIPSTSIPSTPTTPGPTTSTPSASTSVPPTTGPSTTGPPTTGPFTTPGQGLGDEPFPELGNPGIDVTHYDVALAWDGEADRIQATVTIDLVALEFRPTFTLDAEDTVDVSAVTVDGTPATFDHDVPELVVTPPEPLAAGQATRVAVTYSAVIGGTSSAAGLPGGLLSSDIGLYTLNEPDLGRLWLPSNDHPSDKATWRFVLTAPEGDIAVANGTLVGDGPAPGNVWTWAMDDPMATYLVQVIMGPYEHVTGTTAAGLALSSLVLPEDRELVQPYLDEIGPMIDFLDDWFGPYPFDAYGLAVADSVPGLAMEQQPRSLIPRELFRYGDDPTLEAFLSHELAHMWFGNAVTPASWQDIWLNEGFATYAQWMWSDHLGHQSLEEAASRALSFGRRVNTGEPGFDLFGGEVYDGGGVVLHALRRTIGDDAFFTTLRRWAADNAGASRTTADFIALVEEVGGTDLDTFFADWLYTDDTPDRYP